MCEKKQFIFTEAFEILKRIIYLIKTFSEYNIKMVMIQVLDDKKYFQIRWHL